MAKKFKVKVDDHLEFEFTNEEIAALDIHKISSSRFHVLENSTPFKAEIVDHDFLKREYTVKINSSNYKVEIENELDLLIEKMGLSLGDSQIVNDIKAPMPGLILDVNVKPGDEVKEGDYLLVLEAMKMENSLTAPRDGVVKSVAVTKGESVDKNQLLIEME